MTPYPTSFPSDAFDHVLAAVRGQGDAPTLVKDGWEVAGFALKQSIGEPDASSSGPPKVFGPASGPETTHEEALTAVIDEQKKMVHAHGSSEGKKTAIPPWIWKAVIEAAIKVIQDFLNRSK